VNRTLSAALFGACCLVGSLAHAQDPPSAEPPSAPPPAEGPAADAPEAPTGGAAPGPEGGGPGTATGPPPLGNEAGVDGPPAEDAPASGVATTTANPRPSTATFPTGGTDLGAEEPYLYMGLGVGLFLLVGLALLWNRGQSPGEPELPDGVMRLAEVPLIGAPLPSLTDGIQTWTVPADQQDDLVAVVLATLADAHRVLVVAPSSVALPAVAGGPVYRVDGMRPVHLEDPIDTLVEDGGRTPCVLFLLPTDQTAALSEYADALPPGVGGVAILTASTHLPFPAVAASSTPEGWSLQRGDHTLHVIRAPDGRLIPRLDGTPT